MRVAVVGFNLRAAALCRFLLGLKDIEVHWVLAQHDLAEPDGESLPWTRDDSSVSTNGESGRFQWPPLVSSLGRRSLTRHLNWNVVGPKPLVKRLESVFFDQYLKQNVWLNSEPNSAWVQGRESSNTRTTTFSSNWVRRSERLNEELAELLKRGLNWNPKARVLGLRLSRRPELILQAPESTLRVDRIYWCTLLSAPNFESHSEDVGFEKAQVSWEPFGAWFPNSVLSPLPKLSFWIDPRHPELFETGEFFEGSLYRVLCVREESQSWLQVEVLHFLDQDESFVRQKKRFAFLQPILPFADLGKLQRLRCLDESMIQDRPGFQLVKRSRNFFEFTGPGNPSQIPQIFKPWIRSVKVAGSKVNGTTLR